MIEGYILEILLILVIFGISTILFSKAAGTLNPGKVNVISYIYYIFMLQTFAGTALILLGFDKHYTLGYLLNRDKSCMITEVVVFGIAIFLPAFILLWEKMFRVNMKKQYQEYLKKEIECEKEDLIFPDFALLSIGCIVLLIGLLAKIGYIPLLKLIHASADFDFATERTRIGGLYFIHPYLSNIFVLMMVPLLSYVAFAYMLKTKKIKWTIITIALFISSVIIKTYKFEKSSVVFYFAAFIIMLIYYKGGIKMIYMIISVAFMAVIIVAFYFHTGFSGSLFDIYNGPMGRTLFTQVGTLAYCFDLFPKVFGFLGGRSFTPTILRLIGMNSSDYLRSAKLTMAFYGSEKVYDGSAGVMNALFAGEAYANWGYKGVIFAVIWVALILSLVVLLIMKLKKTPSTLALGAVLTIKLGTALEGGFCDFVYSFDLILTVLFLLAIYYFFEREGKIQRYITGISEKVKGQFVYGRKNKK